MGCKQSNERNANAGRPRRTAPGVDRRQVNPQQSLTPLPVPTSETWTNFRAATKKDGFTDEDLALIVADQYHRMARRYGFFRRVEQQDIVQGLAHLRRKQQIYDATHPLDEDHLALPQQVDLVRMRDRIAEIDKAKGNYPLKYSQKEAATMHLGKLPKGELGCQDIEQLLGIVLSDVKQKVGIHANKALQLFKGLFVEEKPFDDWNNIYPYSTDTPWVAENQRWREDEEFARQRIQGMTCTQLFRVEHAVPSGFNVKDKDVASFLAPGKTLKDEIAAGKVYMCDYYLLHNLEHPPPKKFNVCAPYLLLYVNPNGKLMPIAIQLGRTKDALVFTPNDKPGLWLGAKMKCASIDVVVHEIKHHWYWCHAIGEVVYVAMRRNLSTHHPLCELLIPHFRFMLILNIQGREILFGKGGIFSNMAAGYKGSLEVQRLANNEMTWASRNLEEELKSRGVEDPEKLPNYTYRDDGLKMWAIIKSYVAEVVDIFYKKDEDVSEDYEIQAWLDECTSDVGGNIRGIDTTDGKWTTKDQMKKFLTEVIFNTSCFHSAMNNGQYDYFGSVLNMPRLFTMPVPTTRDDIPEVTLAKYLPGYWRSAEQINLTHQLSLPTTDPLGSYYNWNKDFMKAEPKMKPLIHRFQRELKARSDEVAARNKKMVPPYEYLNPNEIAQGTSN